MGRGGVLLVWFLLGITTSLQADKKKPTNNDVQKQKQDVQKAKSKFQQESHDVRQADEQLAKLKAASMKASRDVATVREQIDDEYRNSDFFAKARQAADRAKQQLEQTSAPLLARLRREPVYTELANQRDALRAQLGSKPGDSARENHPKVIAELSAKLRRLEQQAIEADPETKRLKDEFDVCEQRVREIAARREETVDKDKRLKVAKEELEKAKREVDSAEAKLAREAQQAAAAEHKVQQQEQQRRAMEQRQKQQNQKPKKNRGSRPRAVPPVIWFR